MKLKGEFELVKVDQFENKVVAHGAAEERFGKFLEATESGNYIFHFLMEDTTEEEVIDKMAETFEAPKEEIAEDVKYVINGLRATGFLEE